MKPALLILFCAAVGLTGCKKKDCGISYLAAQDPQHANFFTSDEKGRAMVMVVDGNCTHRMVFIKGKWCEKKDRTQYIWIGKGPK